jgi:ABC-type ATPase involved in cell division
MPSVNIVIESEVSRSVRCQQLEAMFDVPPKETQKLEWKVDMPFENANWNIGLIVGPSGAGKSTIGKEVFKNEYQPKIKWAGKSVIDDFHNDLSIEDISSVCSAVGFNTIPAWLRPYSVLSTGEKFRVDIARRLLELPDPIVVDEFTSVVDRQVAKIGAFAIQKYIRRHNRKFIGITCHYDVEDWLMPDWVYDVGAMEYRARGSLQCKRPELQAEIRRVPYEAWWVFAPFHYLTADLHKAAKCFGMFIEGTFAAFAAVLHRPNWRKAGQDVKGVSRLVTLPDWQGLGLSPILVLRLGAAYKALGWRLRFYPAHPALIRVAMKSPDVKMVKKPGYVQKYRAKYGERPSASMRNVSRPGAVFEYCGPAMDRKEAADLVEGRPLN